MRHNSKELEKLIMLAKQGDNCAFDEIVKILNNDIKKLIAKYYITGSDESDVYQEALIGLWKAIIDWNSKKGMAFHNFAIHVCCKRQIMTAISTSNRKKNDPLNNAISLNEPINLSGSGDDKEQTLGDFITDNQTVLDEIIQHEDKNQKILNMNIKLTKLERNVFNYFLKGYSYKEIAEKLLIKVKTVDNALMRIRKKASNIENKLKK